MKNVLTRYDAGYCTQNNHDCENCSLVNYGRDCHNNSVKDSDVHWWLLSGPQRNAAKERQED